MYQTFAAYTSWQARMAKLQRLSYRDFKWKLVTETRVRQLGNEIFEAASVPVVQAIDAALIAELKDLVKTVLEFDAQGFDEWLRDPGIGNRTKDWIAFVLLVDACDVAKVRLGNRK